MWADQSRPEDKGREEERSWNQVLYLERTGMLSLRKKRHQGNTGAGWLLQKVLTEHLCMWLGSQLVPGLGDIVIRKANKIHVVPALRESSGKILIE